MCSSRHAQQGQPSDVWDWQAGCFPSPNPLPEGEGTHLGGSAGAVRKTYAKPPQTRPSMQWHPRQSLPLGKVVMAISVKITALMWRRIVPHHLPGGLFGL